MFKVVLDCRTIHNQFVTFFWFSLRWLATEGMVACSIRKTEILIKKDVAQKSLILHYCKSTLEIPIDVDINYTLMKEMFLNKHDFQDRKKNSAGWGKTAPTVLSYREELSTPGRENPRTPASPKACTVTWAGDHCHSPQAGPHRYHRPGHPRRETQRGDFFNLNLKFAPTGSRTQDLRSAAGFS